MESFFIHTAQQLTHISEADQAIYRERFQMKHYRKGEFFLREGQV